MAWMELAAQPLGLWWARLVSVGKMPAGRFPFLWPAAVPAFYLHVSDLWIFQFQLCHLTQTLRHFSFTVAGSISFSVCVRD